MYLQCSIHAVNDTPSQLFLNTTSVMVVIGDLCVHAGDTISGVSIASAQCSGLLLASSCKASCTVASHPG